ncbi:MAG TPA: proton-conducting transporter membrane subunit [Candidatus Eisenbacteria bacterium]|nr:proton-conducting transporter membrane subunit [Candidatus Eisenbacteria bacterium]
MIEFALVAVPLLAAAVAFLWRSDRSRPWLLPAAGAFHAAMAIAMLVDPPSRAATTWLALDPVARAVLPAISLLFLACSAYGVGYLRLRAERPNRVFVGTFLALLGLLSLALEAQNLGLLWVAVEAATLTTVPLLHFNGTARAFEATWKYLLIGGTGLALALLGSFCLGYASLQGGGGGSLAFSALVAHGPAMSRPWVLVAWVLLLAGYGTKMGLAPMHTWKPDAYGEAPGIVGAMLAGGVTTAAFVAVLRVRQVVEAAGAGDAANRSLLALGIFSMLVAALFLLGTRDYKRMLAYSSIEHMGILTIGAALGAAGVAAALFHLWSNGLTKGALFLSAANMHRTAKGRTSDEVSGLAILAPASARMFVVGLFAVTAFPPFGPFFSELLVLRAALAANQGLVVAGFLGALLLAFFGMTRLGFSLVDGRPRAISRRAPARFRESAATLAPPLALLASSLWLGLATPALLRDLWNVASRMLAVGP